MTAKALHVPRWPAVGDVVGGKYRLASLIGSGAMGNVYEALHVGLDERVAVKLMLPQLVAVDELVMRFMREARASARIKSPHVRTVFDVGQDEHGVPYIAMELLDGLSLSECLDDDGSRFDFGQVASIVGQAARGVEAAHALGIVHRDLKPGNLFLARASDGSVVVKVVDFGIAKSPHENALEATQTGALMGSPHYMAPEQMRSARDVDGRADVWSLGVILYELVTGMRPYEAASFGDLVLDVHSMPPRPIAEARPDVPEALRAIIEACLVRDRELRLASARELADALFAFAGNARLDASMVLEPQLETEALPSDTVVVDALRAAARAWPTLQVSPASFRVALLRAIEQGVDPASACVGDLYVVAGCLEGDTAALAIFDGMLRDVVVPALRRSRAASRTGAIAVELRAHLLGADGSAAGLWDYSGRFPLADWLRAIALRRAHESIAPPRDAAPVAVPPVATPEERLAFRLHFGDGVPLERIAVILGTPLDELAQRLEAIAAQD